MYIGGMYMEQINGKAREHAKKALQLSESTQFAIISCAGNLKDGCNWGFVPLKKAKAYAEALKKDSNITVAVIGNEDVVVEVNTEYLLQNLLKVTSEGGIVNKDLKTIVELQSKAVADCVTFLATKADKLMQGGTVCVYNLNESNRVVYKDKTLPAFKVTISTLFKQLASMNYQVYVAGAWRNPMDCAGHMTEVYKSMAIHETRHGALIHIKYAGDKASAENLKKQFKAQYK